MLLKIYTLNFKNVLTKAYYDIIYQNFATNPAKPLRI